MPPSAILSLSSLSSPRALLILVSVALLAIFFLPPQVLFTSFMDQLSFKAQIKFHFLLKTEFIFNFNIVKNNIVINNSLFVFSITNFFKSVWFLYQL